MQRMRRLVRDPPDRLAASLPWEDATEPWPDRWVSRLDAAPVDDPFAGDRLTVTALGARYGRRRVVHDVSLRVGPGEVVVLIGHNGCGKSTTLHATFGLLALDTGRVVIEGVDVTGTSTRLRRELGAAFVPATGEVFADLSVHDNLVLAAGHRVPKDVVAQRLTDAVVTFPSLEANLPRRAGLLSGGEQRMVGVAMALVAEPKLLLLDEPSKHLARASAIRLLATVAEQARTRRMGVLIAEVNVAAALQIADRVYVMRSGSILAEHAARELLVLGPSAWWRMF